MNEKYFLTLADFYTFSPQESHGSFSRLQVKEVNEA
jgi:hypothetical protein